MILPLITCLLASTSLVSALDVHKRAFQFVGDSFTKAEIAFFAIYSLVFVVQTVLSAACLQHGTRAHRIPYACLFASLFLYAIGMIMTLAQLIVSSNAAGENRDAFVALTSAAAFFSFWAIPLLFLALVFVFEDRYADVRAITRENTGTDPLRPVRLALQYGLALLMFVLGTTTTALETQRNRMILGLSGTFPTVEQISEKSLIETHVYYSFNAFFYASALYLVALTTLVYGSERRRGAFDRITKVMALVATPLYVLYAAVCLVFLIIFSPAGINFFPLHIHELEGTDLANDIIVNFLFAAVAAVLLYLGLSNQARSSWKLTGDSAGLNANYEKHESEAH